jgi:diguanylate cyclase (GGDEF)-like protein/PAS domain S-box-containing protein
MRGQDWQKVFGESFGERLMKAAKQAKVSQRSSAIEFMGVVAGREVGLSFRVTPSGPNDILAVVTDVSDRQRLIEAETRSEARFRSLIEGSADTIMMVSGDGIILYASPAVKRVVGLEEKSLVGRNWLEFIHKEHRPEAAAVWTSLMQGADASSTLDMISTSGDVKPIEISARNLLQNPSVKAVIFNMRDISDRRELESELRHKLVELETRNQALRDASQRDALTGVLNYQAVLSYLEAICEYATEGGSFTVALLDIDRFKEYNSTYGFQAGDELLKQLAIAATEVSREDDVFGRAGSEEFLMILPEATETEAQGVMSRVESQFESRCERAARLSWATLHISGESRTALHVMGELSDALTAIAEQRRAS